MAWERTFGCARLIPDDTGRRWDGLGLVASHGRLGGCGGVRTDVAWLGFDVEGEPGWDGPAPRRVPGGPRVVRQPGREVTAAASSRRPTSGR
jgi:hypothetical protein